MFWLLGFLLFIEVECSQEEPRCIVPNDHGRHPPGDVLACQSGPETEVCVGEVHLLNVLQAGLEERCKEEEEEGEEEVECIERWQRHGAAEFVSLSGVGPPSCGPVGANMADSHQLRRGKYSHKL